MSRISLVIFALAVAGLMAFGASQASASHVSCGDVITEDTTLDSDLDCDDLSGGAPPALTIGADDVTLDLNGHTISTACETDCAGTVVVDDSGGYDRVRIRDGTIRPGGVAVGVALVDVDKSVLEGLTIAGFPRPMFQPGVGISLSDSNDNEIDHSTISGGDPAVLFSASDRNTISRSSIDGGISPRVGDALRLQDGSDDNQLAHSRVSADGGGIGILDSTGNRLTRNSFFTFADAIGLGGAQRTLISHNTVSGGSPGARAIDMFSDSDENVIRRNEVPGEGGIFIRGDRNRVAHNEASASFGGAIVVPSGDANLVRRNEAFGGADDGIAVGPGATNTLVQGNLATQLFDDGIDVDAPGTVVRANTANDNGDLGIEAVEGVIDGGGNRASGNGNPLQCLNVVCR